jgi:hypothetical protein
MTMSNGVRKHFHHLMNDKAFRYRVEKYFWMTNIPAATYLALWQTPLWDKISILYLALVSIYALVLTAGGAEQAAEAAAEVTKED